MYPGFESRKSHDFFSFLFFLCFFFFFFFCHYYYSANLQKFNITVSTQILLLFTPYDAKASSAFSALIYYLYLMCEIDNIKKSLHTLSTELVIVHLKVVIITDLGQRQKSA